MKPTEKKPGTLSRATYEATLYQGAQPTLTLRANIFRLGGGHHSPGARRVNAHYQALSRRLARWGKGPLSRRAAAAKRRAGPEGFSPYGMTVTHQVTRAAGGLLSLYHDHTESDGVRAAVCRTADTWRLNTGTPVTLPMLCGGGKGVKKLLRLALQEAERQAPSNVPFTAPYRKALRRRFRRDRFYLTDEGVALFWEAKNTAPAETGPVTVLIPYEAAGLEADLSDALPAEGTTEKAPRQKKGRLFAGT
ncbi:MAG: hypothetical protein LBT60_06235 [Oscillospiraceae bacterium]|nr:hypothetical protein [Oscillospiraceae bacterium]